MVPHSDMLRRHKLRELVYSPDAGKLRRNESTHANQFTNNSIHKLQWGLTIWHLAKVCRGAFRKAATMVPTHMALGQIMGLNYNRPGDLLIADEFIFGVAGDRRQTCLISRVLHVYGSYTRTCRRNSTSIRQRF
jgi:hypothetical protein